MIASIEDLPVIDKILNHLQAKGGYHQRRNDYLLRRPHQIETGLHSSWFPNFSTWYRNTRIGCLVGYCLNKPEGQEGNGRGRFQSEIQGGVNGLRPDDGLFQAYSASSFLP